MSVRMLMVMMTLAPSLVLLDLVQALIQLLSKRLGALLRGRSRRVIRRCESVGRLHSALHARVIVPAVSTATLRGHAQEASQEV
jgi:hypothetical protein